MAVKLQQDKSQLWQTFNRHYQEHSLYFTPETGDYILSSKEFATLTTFGVQPDVLDILLTHYDHDPEFFRDYSAAYTKDEVVSEDTKLLLAADCSIVDTYFKTSQREKVLKYYFENKEKLQSQVDEATNYLVWRQDQQNRGLTVSEDLATKCWVERATILTTDIAAYYMNHVAFARSRV